MNNTSLQVTYYRSLVDTNEHHKNLLEVALKLEKFHNINHVKKMMETFINDLDRYEIIEKPQHVILKNKATGLPSLHITINRN